MIRLVDKFSYLPHFFLNLFISKSQLVSFWTFLHDKLLFAKARSFSTTVEEEIIENPYSLSSRLY